MDRNVDAERLVRRQLFELTDNVGYGSELMVKVFDEFMHDYSEWQNAKLVVPDFDKWRT